MNRHIPSLFVLKALWIVALACLANLAPAQSQPLTAIGSGYIANASIDCAPYALVIQSHCELLADGDSRCFLQKLDFVQGQRIQKTRFYLYENYRSKEDRSSIRKVACYRGKQGLVFALYSGNLGSCGACEWQDYYSEKGALLWSNRQSFGPTNVPITKSQPRSLAQKGTCLEREDSCRPDEEVELDLINHGVKDAIPFR